MSQADTDTEYGVTADQLDAAILDILRSTEGETLPWRHLRKRLPEREFWPRLWSLTRLVERGQVEVWKDDRGRNYVCLSIPTPTRTTRGRAA